MYIVFVSKSSLIVFMMAIISLLLLVSLLPHLTFTAHVNVGIVNGKEVEPHSRPFMVSVQNKWRHVCGGFLISGRFVMTAAHCWKNENLTALVGAHDIRQNESLRIGVKSYHIHPKFNKCTLQNDIMLLKLEKEVKQNENVMKISIQTTKEDIKPGSECSVAGWGRLDFNGQKSYRLMEADVKVMNNTECKNKWKDNFSGSRMMCVYGHGGSCSEDGGGPLVCGDTAVGITSFGDRKICNSRERPEVYIKIAPYFKWICSIIRKVE